MIRTIRGDGLCGLEMMPSGVEKSIVWSATETVTRCLGRAGVWTWRGRLAGIKVCCNAGAACRSCGGRVFDGGGWVYAA